MTNAADRFAKLDDIRAVAALLVVTIHAPKLFPWLPTHSGLYLSVDLFFCLSGFVLARTYRERLCMGTLTPRRFLIGRAMRFYPLYAVGMLVGTALQVVELHIHNALPVVETATVVTALPGFLYLPAPPHPLLFPLNSPAWSLSAELVVNAIYARLTCGRHNKRFALVWLASFASLALYAHCAGDLDGGWKWTTLPVEITRACLSLLNDALIERCVQRERWSGNIAALLSVLAVPVLLMTAPAWPLAAVCVAFPAIVFIAAHIEPSGVTRTVFLLGGRLSYGIYIIHAPLAKLYQDAPFAPPCGTRRHRFRDVSRCARLAAGAILRSPCAQIYRLAPRGTDLAGCNCTTIAIAAPTPPTTKTAWRP